MDTINKMVAFWVTRVGEGQSFSHTRKDTGESFSVTKYPLTLLPSIESGFDRNIQFTLWVTSQEVANKAKILAENTSERLALMNSPRDFKNGARKTNTFTVKGTGETVSQDQMTVYLVDGAQPVWNRSALPTVKDSGNIRDIDVSDIVKVEPKVVVETSDKPF